MARPSSYKEEYAEQALKLTRLGAIDKDLCDFFHVALSTISKWKLDQPEFSEALKEGKELSDAQIANALFHRARGYSHPAVKIQMTKTGEVIKTEYTQHHPPDTTACIFWLKNRRPDLWRDKPSEVEAIELPTGVTLKIVTAKGVVIVDPEEEEGDDS
jgi:hypothetical protein